MSLGEKLEKQYFKIVHCVADADKIILKNAINTADKLHSFLMA